ncbi:ATP-binding protein [Streptomyces sp. TP-A0874]|uniref:ATP-binding protein n=1 Tax=Streptomyces sp. TP-A0874 TaxID=549819 RepID=UPI000853BDF3|nr:BTAD domain-containing putative transcriptional regulator [Streptomyces sp. TP-A0874]
MRYGILGTTQALGDDGRPVALGGVRLRALLAALALHPGRSRTSQALIDEVWAGEPPADAVGALQALVGRLRRALGHTAVLSSAGGYQLSATPEEVDLHRFERLVRDGTQALDSGAPERAAPLLDEALALWRGPALADLPDPAEPASRAAARHFEARRARFAAALAVGRAAEVLPELTALCAEHPLDEPLQTLRLRALRDTGRHADALAAYETVRREIADHLGADPSLALRALHAELLETEPGGAGPAGTATRSGTTGGTERKSRGNLPARLTSFVGRRSELSQLRADLSTARLVTLTGPGGAGKTRLAQEAAALLADDPDRWPDGVWFAELAPVADEHTVPEAVLTALGGRETVIRGTGDGLRAAGDPAAGDPLSRLVEHCARRRMLVLLDNCEHVVDGAARVVKELLTRCPGLTVLATSREPLTVPGEVTHPVGPLPDPTALRLLAERGAAARSGFHPDDDPRACAEICRRLDGLPLAIELAAARLRMLSPRQIAARLDDRFRLLTSGSRSEPARRQTLRAVVDWSWDLLDGEERAVLRRLSVFAGSCDLPAAEAVCADPPAGPAVPASAPVDPRDIAALLGALVDKSLVVAEPDTEGDMRYRLLETVGEYAAERLDEAGERTATERRHLVHFRELARTTDPLLRGPRQHGWLDRLEREHDNLRAALRRAVASGDEQEALCLVLSLSWFWQLRDHRADARTWSAAAIGLGPDPFDQGPAPPLERSCTDAPPPMPPEQLAEARRGVRLVALVSDEGGMGTLNSAAAKRQLRAIVDSYRPDLPQVCRLPGLLWFFAVVLSGDSERLGEDLEEALRTCRRLGYEWASGFLLQMRSRMTQISRGGASQAVSDADRSFAVFRRLGDAWGMAEALSCRGEAREWRGEYEAAAEDYRAAWRAAEEIGALGQLPEMKARLAGVLLECGSGEEAEAMLREAVSEGERLGDVAQFAARLHLATWLGRTGRSAEAREQLGLLLGEIGSEVPELFQGLVEGLLGWLDVLDRRPADGLARVRRALRKTRGRLAEIVMPALPASQLLYAARAFAALGTEEDARSAARLLGAYDALLVPGYHAPAQERENRRQAEADARAVLPAAAGYAQAHAAGARLSLAEAVALV